jgi:hypothetical protein
MLLAAWDARRATVDVDFLARNLNLDEESVLRRVVEIAALPAPVGDGVEFRTDTARANTIRDGDVYGGVRIAMDATIAGAAVKLRLDISTGDPVAPPPAITLLRKHPRLSILGYPLPVVLAEKLCTAVDYGVVRAGAYTAYRRRLGPDATELPEGFARVVDDVITFADPILASKVTSQAIWTAENARWN